MEKQNNKKKPWKQEDAERLKKNNPDKKELIEIAEKAIKKNKGGKK